MRNLFFIIAAAFLLSLPSYADNKGVNFHPVGIRDGFWGEVFFCSTQDSLGMMWFGSENGLYVWDGTRMKNYRHNQNDSLSLSAPRVNAIYHYNSSVAYIATTRGLNIMDRTNDSFSTLPAGSTNVVFFLIRQSGNQLWYGTNNGLYRLDLKTQETKEYAPTLAQQSNCYFCGSYVICGHLTNDDQFVTGSYNYVSFFEPEQDRFVHYKLPFEHIFGNNLLLSVQQDIADPNKYWLGTEQALFLWDKTNQHAEIIMRGNPIKTMQFHNDKTLWIGTDDGLYYKKNGSMEFTCLNHDSDNHLSLPSNVIWNIFIDRERNLWLATHNGVCMASPRQLPQSQKIKNITGSNRGNQLFTINAHTNELLMGGTQGAVFYNSLTKKTVLLNSEDKTKHRLTHNRIRHIYRDKQGVYWIASDKGLNSYDPTTDRVCHFDIASPEPESPSTWMYHIQEHDNKLYIATYQGGVFVVDKSQLTNSKKQIQPFKHYSTHTPKQKISSNITGCIAFTDSASFWVATISEGLCKIPYNKEQAVAYFNTTNNRLSSNIVKNIVDLSGGRLAVASPDLVEVLAPNCPNEIVYRSDRKDIISIIKIPKNRLLVNSLKGLTLLDLDHKTSSKINIDLLSSGPIHSVFYDSTSNFIHWGGIDLFGSIRLSDFQSGFNLTKPHITNLLISGKLIHPNKSYAGNVVLKDQISNLGRIELLSQQNSITFEFSSLKFSQWQSTSYNYRLLGLSNEWQTSFHNENHATYLNLPSGRYVFQVTMIQPNGSPSQAITSLIVTIAAPWYYSTLAWVVYSLISLIFLWLIFMVIRSNQKLYIEQINKQKSLKFSQMKINFMTDIAHELKTPLALILGKISSLIGREKAGEKCQQLISIHRNAQQIEQLILQTLQNNHFNKGLTGTLSQQTIPLAPFLTDLTERFKDQLPEKNLIVSSNFGERPIFVSIDKTQFRSVVDNLISNAIKFSYPNGSIHIEAKLLKVSVELSVRDNGRGIAQADIPHIFERFFQSSNQPTSSYVGHGLGLAIARDIVLAHQGQITVISQINQGSCFTVSLPRANTPQSALPKKSRTAIEHKKYEILVVEDNLEMLEFIAQGLCDDFVCYKAQNAKSGFQMALEHRPALILTDLMMPDMRGDELTAKIRNNIYLSSTPIIILTAANDQSNEIGSYSSGADCFIEKPFDMNNLVLRIWQLIRKAEVQQQKIRQEIISIPTYERAVSLDDKFMERITQIIETHIEDPDLSLSILSHQCKLAQKQVYRKIKQLTGVTPTDYIRQVRIKRAALLFDQGGFSISEVVYMVGFSSHSYFSKCFKQALGVTPSEYVHIQPK